jgi:hypothetical protein
MGERTKLCDYTNTPNDHFIARPITTPDIQAESFEVSPSILNLINRSNLVVVRKRLPLCIFMILLNDKQKFKNVENDVLKLKLFPFSLRGKAKEWLHSLPTSSTKSWGDFKIAFIKKYYAPVKTLQNREIVFFLLGKMKMNM